MAHEKDFEEENRLLEEYHKISAANVEAFIVVAGKNIDCARGIGIGANEKEIDLYNKTRQALADIDKRMDEFAKSNT